MSYYATDQGHVDFETPSPARSSRRPCRPETEAEALQLQLKTLGDAAASVVLALFSEDGLSARVAAEFAAICDQTAGMALRVGEQSGK